MWVCLYNPGCSLARPVLAPDEGADIAQLMRASGMPRPTLYRHLAQLGRDGHVIQVSRGRWRAATTEDRL